MSKYWLYTISLSQLVVIALLVVILSREQNVSDGDSENYLTVFENAIVHASYENTKKELAKLFPASKDNEDLTWKEIDGKEYLSVVAWMKDSDYKNYYQTAQQDAEPRFIPENVSLWVTLNPEVREFCQSIDAIDKSFRIKQFLGLDPNRSYETFVELWVQAEDLFRPCPDPEVNDTTCELSFNDEQPPAVKNIGNYAAYYRELIDKSYGSGGAPWTRLGYTYDWAFNRRNIGASEYILVPNGQYYVHEAYSTQQYCH